MTPRFVLCASSLLIVLILTACSTSAPPRYYTLDATASPGGLPATHGTVAIDPIAIPASVDQPQFVTEAGPNRVEVDEFNRWASPLSENIARVVAQNLRVLLGAPEVTASPLANFVPDYSVAIEVLRFQSVRGHGTTLEAVWTVHRTGSSTTQSSRTTAEETVQDDSFASLAAAHSRALVKLSEDIAGAIRIADRQTLTKGSAE
jgi:uncharacterized protein